MLGLANKPDDRKAHFRKGATEEWREVFTDNALGRMSRIMDEFQITDFIEEMKSF